MSEDLARQFLRAFFRGFTTTVPGTPSQQKSFAAGQGGFDNEISPLIFGRFLSGFKIGVNIDNFINSCAVYTNDTYPS
jgi:hypothetical protein